MRWTFGSIGLLTMMLAACGDGGDQSANTAAPAAAGQPAPAVAGADPCRLVTADEIAEIIGQPITAKAAHDTSCQYQTADAAASSVTVEIDQADAAGAMALQRKAAGMLKDAGGAVAGEGGAGADANAMLSEGGAAPKLGDEALFGPNQQLSVRKGASFIAVTPPTMRSRMAAGNPMLSAEDKRRMAVAVAEKALARLP